MPKLFKEVIQAIPSKQEKSFSDNDVIVGSGKVQKDCYYIIDGFVKVYDLNADGNIKTIAILKKGDMFPLIWAFDHPPETVYYYKAMGTVSAARVETQELRQTLTQEAEVSRSVQLAFVYLSWDFMERIKCLQMPYTQEKILRLLPYLVAKLGGVKNRSGAVELTYDITQEEIAQMLGTTRESVSAHLAKLENKGIIDRSTKRMKITMSEIPEEYIHDLWFEETEQ